MVNIRPLSLAFLVSDILWENHNDQVLALTRSQQCQLWTSFNRQAGCSKVPALTNLRCMSSWQQNNYFLRGSYCLQHAMNSVQVQCQFITLHYLRQLTSWVQLLKKREIISALVHLDSPPPAPNKCSEGKKALSNLKSQNASLCESTALVQQPLYLRQLHSISYQREQKGNWESMTGARQYF